MKAFGILATVLGLIWGVSAASMSTAVYTSSGSVNNIGLIAERQAQLGMAGLVVLVGVILIVAGSRKGPSTAVVSDGSTRACPFCAETVKRDAVVCRYCGRDLPACAPPDPLYCPKCGSSQVYLDYSGKTYCPQCGKYVRLA